MFTSRFLIVPLLLLLLSSCVMEKFVAGGEGKQGLGESKKTYSKIFLGEHHLLIGTTFFWGGGVYTFLKMLKKQSMSRLTNLPLVAFRSPQRDQALSEYAYKSFLLSPQ